MCLYYVHNVARFCGNDNLNSSSFGKFGYIYISVRKLYISSLLNPPSLRYKGGAPPTYTNIMDAMVLGGTRFLGLHLVRLLHSQGHSITVLNRRQTRATLPPEVGPIRADRSEPAQMAAALKGRRFDAVFDISGYRPSEVQPVADALGGAVGHYVFCSSVAVYATSEVAPILEDSPLIRGPAGDYSRDKILCEELLLEMYNRRGFPTTVIRPPYVYGPDDPGMRRLFSIFARLKQGRRVIAPANGLTLTHTVHVDDLASAFAAVPGRTHAQGQVYNAAASEAITFNASSA